MIGPALALSGMLFAIGAIGMLVRRDLFVALMSLQLMFAGSLLALVAFSRLHADAGGQVLAWLVLAVAAAQAALGIALAVARARGGASLDVEEVQRRRDDRNESAVNG